MNPNAVYAATILIAEDDHAVAELLSRILASAGFGSIHTVTDPHAVVDRCTELDPDLLLLDLRMPEVSGFDILTRLAPLILDDGELPVLVLSGEADRVSRCQALRLGARDYVEKPFDSLEVTLRVRNLLTTRLLQRSIARENHQLERQLVLGDHKLATARLDAARHLAAAAACRDGGTQEHNNRVGRCAAAVANEMGLDRNYVRQLRVAATLHDVGKIGIPDRILLKPGPLTANEFAVMQGHTTLGSAILAGSEIPELAMAEAIARTHHERWGGGGYPAGLAGEAIDLAGRVTAVADVFDALTHCRPYKVAWDVTRTVEEIAAGSGSQFDPNVVEAFMALDHDALAAGSLEVVNLQVQFAGARPDLLSAEGTSGEAPRHSSSADHSASASSR